MSKKVSTTPLDKLPVTAEAEAKKDPAPGLDNHEQRFLAIEDAVVKLETNLKTSNAEMKSSIAEIKTSMARFEELLLSSLQKSDVSDSKKAIDVPLDVADQAVENDPDIAQVDMSTSFTRKQASLPSNLSTSNPSYDFLSVSRRIQHDLPEPPTYHTAFQDTDRRKSAGDFYDRHLSCSSYMEVPTNNGYIRTLHSVDPLTSGVCLSHLDVANFFRWSQDIITLQKRVPHEELQHCLFLSRTVQFKINAWNEAKRFFGKPIMCGSTLSLENRSLSIIISQMVMPETEIEWIFTFKKLAVFPKLPKNQHEVIPDATNFDDWWSGIILYIFDANVINDFLAAVPANIKPVMKTFNQKPGLMQIFYDQIPMSAGKNINNLIDYNDLKQCENLRQYTDLFLEKANDINESSKIAKINRQKLASQNLYITPPDIKIHNNNLNEKHKFNNNNNTNNNGHKFNNNNMDNKMNGFRSNNLNNKNYSNNHGDHTNTPYKNPYERRLHRIQEDQVSENFVDNHWNSCDVDNDDEYDEPLLSTSNDNFSVNIEKSHDIDDSYNHDNSNDDNYIAYDNSDSFEGLNPGSNVTNNLSVIQNSGSQQQVRWQMQQKRG
jgi:hypothetical protein